MTELERIICKVSQATGIETRLITGKSRKQEYVNARYLCFLIIKRKFPQKLSLKSIGDTFGGRDHTTIIHGLQTIKAHIETHDQLVMAYIDRILEAHPEWTTYFYRERKDVYNGVECNPTRLAVQWFNS